MFFRLLSAPGCPWLACGHRFPHLSAACHALSPNLERKGSRRTPPADHQDLLLDSHCHAWRLWPYPPLVPDEGSRGTIEQLIYEMDVHGVQQAAVVCAGIENNRDNVEYVAFARDRYRGRIHVLADLDCTWHDTYHAPGSADRLKKLDDRHRVLGFTHYVTERNDGWLASEEAEAVFAVAAERDLLVSLAASPAWQADLRKLARRHPTVPVLCHHLGRHLDRG